MPAEQVAIGGGGVPDGTRILVVDNGKLSLYGTVESKMDKDIAGIRAGGVFGVFQVQNNLVVAKS